MIANFDINDAGGNKIGATPKDSTYTDLSPDNFTEIFDNLPADSREDVIDILKGMDTSKVKIDSADVKTQDEDIMEAFNKRFN